MSDTPEPLEEDSNTELLRLWLEDDTLHCSLQLASDDPAFWGTVLADLTRHIAEALVEGEEGGDAAKTLELIRDALDEDLDALTEEEDEDAE